MGEVQVDIEDRCPVLLAMDDVAVPDLFEQRARLAHKVVVYRPNAKEKVRDHPRTYAWMVPHPRESGGPWGSKTGRAANAPPWIPAFAGMTCTREKAPALQRGLHRSG